MIIDEVNSSSALKHINAMIGITILIPLAWIAYSAVKENSSIVGSLRGVVYYALLLVLLSGMKKGNGKNRKFVGYMNLIGVVAATFYLFMGSENYPMIGIALMACGWAYIAWACLFSKSVRGFLSTTK